MDEAREGRAAAGARSDAGRSAWGHGEAVHPRPRGRERDHRAVGDERERDEPEGGERATVHNKGYMNTPPGASVLTAWSAPTIKSPTTSGASHQRRGSDA